jgi:hypothetical protein
MAIKKLRSISLLVVSMSLIVSPLISLLAPSKVFAATSPTLVDSVSYSVLSGTTVTNTGATSVQGNIGISPAGGGGYAESGSTAYGAGSSLHNADTSAANAQADNIAAFGTIDQGCTTTYAGTQDLVGLNLVPGVYCADAFELSGTLTLSGSGVWIFKSAATLVTSGTANVVGGDSCNVWWRLVSSATLGTNTSLIGNILASTAITMATGATLNGRAFAYTAAVTLDSNTISGPVCTAAVAETTASTTTSAPVYVCPTIPIGIVTPTIIEAKRVDADSIFLSWGPYSGTDKFIVRYGPTDGNWLYNTDITGFSATINALPANQSVWVQVAARNECQIGNYGASKQVGGVSVSRVLGASTDTLAATGSFDQFIRILFAATATLFVFLLGKALLRSNEVS